MAAVREHGLFGVACLPYLALVTATAFVCDDAMISFRYARRLAAGHGPRFNLLNEVPVEGFSNPLWVFLSAIPEALGARAPDVMPWVSALAGVLVLRWVWDVLRRLGVGVGVCMWSVVALGAFPPFAVWGTGGLETMVFTLSIVLLLEASLRGEHQGRLAMVAAAVVLLRTEGWLWVGVVGVLGALVRQGEGRCRAPLRGLVVGGVVAAVGWELFRLGYYGDWVANTVRVKAGLSVRSVARGVVYLLLAGALFPGLWVALSGMRQRRVRPYALMAALLLGWAALVGGDYLPYFRFLVPATPLVAVVGGAALGRLAERRLHLGFAALLVVVVVDLLPIGRAQLVPGPVLFALQRVVGTKVASFQSPQAKLAKEQNRYERRRLRAEAMREVTAPGDSVVALGVGALGYWTELEILDRYGLVTKGVTESARAWAKAAPGHDLRVQRGHFIDADPDWLYAIALHNRHRHEVVELLPRQWALFEDIGGHTLVAELHVVADPRRLGPRQLLLVRSSRPGEDADALREVFKDQLRAADYRPPRLLPLNDRRRRVAEDKREGGDEVFELLREPGAWR